MRKLIQKGNTKLHNCYMWNIHADEEICGRICPNCYARKEQARYPTVRNARIDRYVASLENNFSDKIISELGILRNPPKYFRIHASGEFYSQEYIKKWEQIVKNTPNITFYAYTKRMADFNFIALAQLKNMVLIDSSLGGEPNYGRLEDAPSGCFICPSHDKAVKCGESCTYCMTKGKADVTGVYFKKH